MVSCPSRTSPTVTNQKTLMTLVTGRLVEAPLAEAHLVAAPRVSNCWLECLGGCAGNNSEEPALS